MEVKKENKTGGEELVNTPRLADCVDICAKSRRPTTFNASCNTQMNKRYDV